MAAPDELTADAAPAAATVVPESGMTVVRRRYPGRWIAAIIVLLICGRFLWSVMTNDRFGWDVVGAYLYNASILNGLAITVGLTVISMVIGIVFGIVLAVMRLSRNPVVQGAALSYVFFFRGTPLLVQLLFWYNMTALYPVITFGLPWVALDANHLITPITAAILGLGLNEAAYMSEITRGGIMSVGHGQSEAAGALGMQKLQTMRRVVLPQAMRVIVPPTGNEVINMLKNSALVSVMAVPDLLYSAQIIYSRTFETIPLLIVASIWYLVVTAVLGVAQYYIERWYARGNAELPPTPVQWIKRKLRNPRAPQRREQL
jgi:polar amino acid transport system permease protein